MERIEMWKMVFWFCVFIWICFDVVSGLISWLNVSFPIFPLHNLMSTFLLKFGTYFRDSLILVLRKTECRGKANCRHFSWNLDSNTKPSRCVVCTMSFWYSLFYHATQFVILVRQSTIAIFKVMSSDDLGTRIWIIWRTVSAAKAVLLIYSVRQCHHTNMPLCILRSQVSSLCCIGFLVLPTKS